MKKKNKKNFINIFFYIILFFFLLRCSLSPSEIKERDEYLYRAQIYYKNKKYLNALQQIEKALEIDPECKAALIAKGWTLFYLQRYEASEKIFKKAFNLDDTDPWIRYGLGAVYFKKALKINKIMGNIQQKIKNYSEKEKKEYEKDIERYKKTLEEYLDIAIEHFKKALEIMPENYELHKMTALTYAAKGIDYYLDAIEYLKRCIKLLEEEYKGIKKVIDKKEKERLNTKLMDKKREKLDLIIETLKTQLEKNKKNYCEMLKLTGDFYFKLALKSRNDKNKDLYKNYLEKAYYYISRILERDPDIAPVYLYISEICKLQNKYKLAIKYLQDYLDKYPLANPKVRVKVKLEIEDLKKNLNNNKKEEK